MSAKVFIQIVKKVDDQYFLLKKGRNLSSFCRVVEGRISIKCGEGNINYLTKLCSLDSLLKWEVVSVATIFGVYVLLLSQCCCFYNTLSSGKYTQSWSPKPLLYKMAPIRNPYGAIGVCHIRLLVKQNWAIQRSVDLLLLLKPCICSRWLA